jgi:hypothetical protein
MEQIKLAALRDFAIQHFPRAQTVSTSLPADLYQRTLYGFAALAPATAPAIVQAAARLLQSVLGLSIEWEDATGELSDHHAVEAAKELCTLTGHTIPWLAAAPTPAPVAPSPVVAAPPPAPARPLLQPGPTQTTAYAAAYLGVTEQYMRVWASEGDGPITPVKQGSRNRWPTDDLIRLAAEGWKPRRKKPGQP